MANLLPKISLPGNRDTSTPLSTSKSFISQGNMYRLGNTIIHSPSKRGNNTKSQDLSGFGISASQVLAPTDLNFTTAIQPSLSNREPTMTMPSVVDSYLDKQNLVMSRILKDVEDYKNIEYMRQRMLLEQQYALLNPLLYGVQQPRPYVLPVPVILTPTPGYLPTYPANPDYYNQQPPRPEPISKTPVVNPPKRGSIRDSFAKPKPRHSSMDRSDLPSSRDLRNKKNAKKHNRGNGRKLLRMMAWTLALPGVWWVSVVNYAETRLKRELKALEIKVPDNLETFLKFAAGATEQQVRKMATDKNALTIAIKAGAGYKSGEIEKKCTAITDYLVAILDNMTSQLRSGELPLSFFQFLGSISENDAILPESFLSNFEIDRLSFNVFGNLKWLFFSLTNLTMYRDMNAWRSKMILATFILLKGVLRFLILRPWMLVASVSEKNTNIKTVVNVGSVLYHAILDVLRENVPETKVVGVEPPFKGKHLAVPSLEKHHLKKLDFLPDKSEDVDQDIFLDLYNKDRLFLYFKSIAVNPVKDAIVDFLDELYSLTHKAIEPKWHVKENFANYRPE